MSQLLFVYGTIKRGCPLHSWVEDQTFVGETVLGSHTLISLGAYPALIKVGSANFEVKGELYELDDKRFEQLKSMEEAVGYTTEDVRVMDPKAQLSRIDCKTFLFTEIAASTVEWQQPPPPKGTRGRASSFPGHVAIV